MKIITLTGTKERLTYPNEHWKPFRVIADMTLPKMYNRGWNVFEFTEQVKFICKDMPLIPEREAGNYQWYRAAIEVFTSDGKSCNSGYYELCVKKDTGEIVREKVDFG